MAGSGEHDVSFEVLLIGDSWVGKSCVAETYDEDSPHPTSLGRTMGVHFVTKTIEVEGKKVKLQIWDTPGEQRIRGIITAYL
ncbi:Ras-related protein Rab-13, partial [Geodia barretti]